MSLLVVLHEFRGQAVAKDQLSHRVWGDQGASDELIARHISKIRKALDDDPKQSCYLETIPTIGYRLFDIDQVSEVGPSAGRKSPQIAIGVIIFVIALVFWLKMDRDLPLQPQPRLLETGLPLLSDEHYRGDLATAAGRELLAFIQSERLDVGGPLLVHNLREGTQTVIADGWNRFPSFSPDGEHIASFGAAKNGSCVLSVRALINNTRQYEIPCQGEPVSPPVWLDQHTLLIAEFDPELRQSILERIDLPTGTRSVAYQPEESQLLRFPRVVGGDRLVALLSSEGGDDLLELNLASGQSEVIHKMEKGSVRWIDTDPNGDRILIVKADTSDRFVLFEANLDERVVRLIGNNEPAQSASYHPTGHGVLYAAIRYQRRHLLYQRDPNDRFRARSLSLRDESVGFALISPDGDRLIYLSAAQPGTTLNMVRISNSDHSALLSSRSGERLGFPAWSPDGSQVIVAATSEAGNAVYIFDLKKNQLIGRFPVAPAVGPVQLSRNSNQAILTEQLGTRIKVYRLAVETGALQLLFEVDGHWGQMALDEKSYYFVDQNFMLHQAVFTIDGPKSRVIAPVGSKTGWQVLSDALYFACPQSTLTKAKLCEMDLVDGTVRFHPEVRFSPIRVSVSVDGNALVAPWFENTRLILTHARWAKSDGMDAGPKP